MKPHTWHVPSGTRKVLLPVGLKSIEEGLSLTRPEWQKKRKKMASKMGKAEGRVR